MFNPVGGNGATVTEKLGLDQEVRELKFGSSFNPGNKGQQGQGSFHTVRYDFKPASVDTSKMATLEVGPSGQMTISMPHFDSSGNTVFKGSTRPYTKECVLIIDKDTGEVVLEKLTNNIQMKKTRQERPEGAGRSSKGTAPTGAVALESKVAERNVNLPPVRNEQKSPPKDEKHKNVNPSNPPSSQHQLNPSNTPHTSSRRRPISPMVSGGMARHSHSPMGRSPGNNSPNNVSDTFVSNKQQQSQSFMPSLTSIEDLLITPPAAASPSLTTTIHKQSSKNNSDNIKHHVHNTSKTNGGLSDSSSGDDSSSSSSSEDDDSSSMEEVEIDPDKIPLPAIIGRELRSVSPVSTKNMSMPSFSTMSHGGASTSNKQYTAPSVIASMPSHLLSEDLQLSESGSDSD